MECHHDNANTKRLLTLASEAPRVSQQNKLPMEQFNVVRAKRLLTLASEAPRVSQQNMLLNGADSVCHGE